jgi:hypothetical protein
MGRRVSLRYLPAAARYMTPEAPPRGQALVSQATPGVSPQAPLAPQRVVPLPMPLHRGQRALGFGASRVRLQPPLPPFSRACHWPATAVYGHDRVGRPSRWRPGGPHQDPASEPQRLGVRSALFLPLSAWLPRAMGVLRAPARGLHAAPSLSVVRRRPDHHRQGAEAERRRHPPDRGRTGGHEGCRSRMDVRIA